MSKNSFVDLRNEVRDLKRMYIEVKKQLAPVFYDPIEYIELTDDLEIVLKFKNNYYAVSDASTLSKALGRTRIDCDSRTLKRLIDDKSRWKELWSMGIETQYMKLTQSGKWICSDGNVLRKNLTAYQTNKGNSFIRMKNDGNIVDVNRGQVVVNYFIDEEVDENGIYWLDDDFNNCEIYNLTTKDRRKDSK